MIAMHPQDTASLGYSLLELLVAIAVLVAIAGLAVPNFRVLIATHERQLLADELSSSLRAARMEAINRNRTVIVQAMEEDWAKGWRIIVDETGKGSADSNNPTLVIRRGNARIQAVATKNMQAQVAFNYLGIPRSSSHAALNGSIHFCDPKGSDRHRRVVLARSGRVRVATSPPPTPLCPATPTS
ncbi:GspH/FimT family pseudopilin [Pseudomonas japonica]|uniref:GspH/FimT family pseudopilin n=1 Tax=Pseudomonas japonica TaxID=256466 RepID=UPI0015E404BB|nr:GspH/FimT family pseudopilin [Pseudomonas japonica]MBA1244059.1 general secretion pathway protein GspH [Pseudomonas japonica]